MCSKYEQCSVCEQKKEWGVKRVEKSMLKSSKKVGRGVEVGKSSKL